ncbi:hypothetical protein [Demequina aurantiaca]|uniref:hypothetical protein n=1 Tax=Demequina aurantiaca TaxID=676200 RepID=UPI003D357543
MGTDASTPSPYESWDDHAEKESGRYTPITGIPRWLFWAVPFGLIVLIVAAGFLAGVVTSVDGGPGFATPSPRAPAQ